MDKNKLEALKAKYADLSMEDEEHPGAAGTLAALAKQSSGVRTFLSAPYQEDLTGLDIALVGVPFDLGVTHRAGARFGPKAVRDISITVGPYNHHTKLNPFALCEIADIGDVPLAGFNLDHGIEKIEAFYHRFREQRVAPLTVGGDHSITYPILNALARDEPVGLIHVDAHCDTMGQYEDSKFHHGGPFRNAVLSGALDPERTIQIGIRGTAEAFWQFSYDSGMTVVHVEDFQRMGVDAVIEKARQVVGDGPTYISFDVDGLDPVYTPGTGTPEVGGLTTREAQDLIRGLQGLNLVGGDVVEVAPEYDATTNTAHTAKHMLFEIACVLADSLAAKKK